MTQNTANQAASLADTIASWNRKRTTEELQSFIDNRFLAISASEAS